MKRGVVAVTLASVVVVLFGAACRAGDADPQGIPTIEYRTPNSAPIATPTPNRSDGASTRPVAAVVQSGSVVTASPVTAVVEVEAKALAIEPL